MSIFHEIQMAIFRYTAWGYCHMVRQAGSPARTVHVDVTLTRSKVKVKITGLLKFRKMPKLHFPRSIFSVILSCSSKLRVDRDSTRPTLLLVGVRYSNFLLRRLSREFKLRGMSIFTRISNGHISVVLEATATWYGTLVALYVLRILMWTWSDLRSRSRSLISWSSENCTFLRLHLPLFWRGACNWWVITIVCSFSEPDFWIFTPIGGTIRV